MSNIILTDSLSDFGYIERNIEINKEFIDFFGKTYHILKNTHIEQGHFSPFTPDGSEKEYCSGRHANLYNLFLFKDFNIHKIYKIIQEMTIEYCNKNNIDYLEEKYYIHGFFTYKKAGTVSVGWHDHGSEKNHLHGFLLIDAEPSETWYNIDDKEIHLIAKNGRIILGKNAMHTIAPGWQENKPRISMAFNIKPLNEMPEDSFYTPLL